LTFFYQELEVVAPAVSRCQHQGTVSKHFNRGGETSPSTLAVRLGSTYYHPVCNNATFRFYLLPACRPQAWRVLTSGFYLLPSLSPFFVTILLLSFATFLLLFFASFFCHFHASSCVAPIISTCDLCSEMPCIRE
jgi:hypothetical protein